jgi:hypothetical protein
MREPRIPARESGRLLLEQACKPTGRPVGEGQVKKRDKLKWSGRRVPSGRVSTTYRTPESAYLQDVLRIWKENA